MTRRKPHIKDEHEPAPYMLWTKKQTCDVWCADIDDDTAFYIARNPEGAFTLFALGDTYPLSAGNPESAQIEAELVCKALLVGEV
jgi:hypothetical protein